MKYQTTQELREYLDRLLSDVESGAITNAGARVRCQIAKSIVDTLKVEIAACALGKQFAPVALGRRDQIKAAA